MERLNSATLAKANLRFRPLRSFFLVLLLTLLSLAMVMTSQLSQSFAKGLELVSNRLGADVMVVPSGYKAEIESVLLKGEASDFLLPEGALEKLQGYPGIRAISPQLYVATLKSSCCSYPVQIIGIDPETDFVIKPWLPRQGKDLAPGEVLVGANIKGEVGERLHFFEQELSIRGHLEKTGLGFDSSVFVHLETAKQLLQKQAELSGEARPSLDRYSCLMIKAKDGIDASKLASKLTKDFSQDQLFAMFSKRFVKGISEQLGFFSLAAKLGLALVWFLSVVILVFSFMAQVSERRREWAVLSFLGLRQRSVLSVLWHEAIYLSAVGLGLGLFLGTLMSMLLLPRLASSFHIPLEAPSLTAFVALLVLTAVLVLLSVLLALLPALRRLAKADPCQQMRE